MVAGAVAMIYSDNDGSCGLVVAIVMVTVQDM